SEKVRKVEYVMIGDPSGTLSRSFDVYDEQTGLAQRGTFIVDPDGVIQAVEITADGIGRDADTVVKKLKAAKYVRERPGEVCPAKWDDSGGSRKPSLEHVGKIGGYGHAIGRGSQTAADALSGADGRRRAAESVGRRRPGLPAHAGAGGGAGRPFAAHQMGAGGAFPHAGLQREPARRRHRHRVRRTAAWPRV